MIPVTTNRRYSALPLALLVLAMQGCGTWATEMGNSVEEIIQSQDKRSDEPREVEIFEDGSD